MGNRKTFFLALTGLVSVILFYNGLCLAKSQAVPKKDKAGILLVTFGSTVPETRQVFKNIESRIQQCFPDDQIRWAYSSRKVREKLLAEGLFQDSPLVALAKMIDERYSHIVVVSLHVIPGEEYHDLVNEVNSLKGLKSSKGTKLAISGPLLSSRSGVEKVSKVVLANLPTDRQKNEAVALVGHGSEKHPSDLIYAAFNFYAQKNDDLVFVTSVDGQPPFDEVVQQLKARGVKKTYLVPLMSVAGEHVRTDMCGATEDSLKSQLRREGISAECVLRGLAEYPDVVEVWVDQIVKNKKKMNQSSD